MNDKKMKHPYFWYGRSFTGLDRRFSQPQHSLKPKPNPEQDLKFLQFYEGWEKWGNCQRVSQFSSVAQSCPTWTAAGQAFLSITKSQSLLKLMSIKLVMPSNHLILCHPLLLLPSIFPSIRVFSKESVLHIRVAKVLEFQLQHQSFQWIFRNDFLLDWLAWSPCSPRDFQESSPTLQFKSISSSALSFLYSPTLTSIHDYSKKS